MPRQGGRREEGRERGRERGGGGRGRERGGGREGGGGGGVGWRTLLAVRWAGVVLRVGRPVTPMRCGEWMT